MKIYNEKGEQLYTIGQVAEFMNVSRRTISTYLIRGTFPKPVGRIGREPLWSENQFDD